MKYNITNIEFRLLDLKESLIYKSKKIDNLIEKTSKIKEPVYLFENKNGQLFRYCYYDLEIRWDITKIQELIEKNNFKIEEVPINKPFHDMCNVDIEYAKATIITPIIIVEMPDQKLIIIDGNHRTYNAKLKGQKTISAYILPYKKTFKGLYNVDDRARLKIIEKISKLEKLIKNNIKNEKRNYKYNKFQKYKLLYILFYSNIALFFILLLLKLFKLI